LLFKDVSVKAMERIERIDGEKWLSEATVDDFKRNAFGCESNRKRGRSRIKTVAGSFF
jgi:hypothetical protein